MTQLQCPFGVKSPGFTSSCTCITEACMAWEYIKQESSESFYKITDNATRREYEKEGYSINLVTHRNEDSFYTLLTKTTPLPKEQWQGHCKLLKENK